VKNLFALPQPLPADEWFQTLLNFPQGKLERIVSHGQITPEGEWYDQAQSEWVVLLQGQAQLAYADGEEQTLSAGDWVLIPPHRLHRVTYTSTDPACIWLALHLETLAQA
jgi:cupin 2 domain-containing protein